MQNQAFFWNSIIITSSLPQIALLSYCWSCWPRVFILSFLSLVVDAEERVDVPLDGVPGGVPHLVDEVDGHAEEQEENTGEGVIALFA